MDCESTVLSTRLRSSMQIIDKNIGYMQQVVNRGNLYRVFSSTMVLPFNVAAY